MESRAASRMESRSSFRRETRAASRMDSRAAARVESRAASRAVSAAASGYTWRSPRDITREQLIFSGTLPASARCGPDYYDFYHQNTALAMSFGYRTPLHRNEKAWEISGTRTTTINTTTKHSESHRRRTELNV